MSIGRRWREDLPHSAVSAVDPGDVELFGQTRHAFVCCAGICPQS